MLVLPDFVKVQDADLTMQQAAQLIADLQPTDEVFQNEGYGLFNVGIMRRLLVSHPEWFEAGTLPIDDAMMEYVIKNVEISKDVITSMSPARFNEPVFVVTLDDAEPHLLIDGHHRIVARGLSKLSTVRAYIANREATDLINVVKWRKTT